MDTSAASEAYEQTVPASPPTKDVQFHSTAEKLSQGDVEVAVGEASQGQAGDDLDDAFVEPPSMRQRASNRLRSKSLKLRKEFEELGTPKENIPPKNDSTAEEALPAADEKNLRSTPKESSGRKTGKDHSSYLDIKGYWGTQTYRSSVTFSASAQHTTSSQRPALSQRKNNKPCLDALSEAEIEQMTLSNTKKNAHRNIKARFARVFQTLETLAMVPEIEALPLVRPEDLAPMSPTSSGPLRQMRVGEIPEDELSLVEISQNGALEGSNEGSMEFEPASTAMDSFTFERPSVRISTGVTVVSVTEISRLGREAVRVEQRKQHPDRRSARVLVPRSQMLSADDFKNLKSPKPAPLLAKSLQRE